MRVISDNPEGGTGKGSIYERSKSHMKKLVTIDGKAIYI